MVSFLCWYSTCAGVKRCSHSNSMSCYSLAGSVDRLRRNDAKRLFDTRPSSCWCLHDYLHPCAGGAVINARCPFPERGLSSTSLRHGAGWDTRASRADLRQRMGRPGADAAIGSRHARMPEACREGRICNTCSGWKAALEPHAAVMRGDYQGKGAAWPGDGIH